MGKQFRLYAIIQLTTLCLFFACTCPAIAEYWGMVGAPDWQGNPGYSRQSWAFASKPAWQEVDLDHDGDSDAFLVDGKGYGADAGLENKYGGAYFIRSDYGDSFAWNYVDEGPMGQDWEGLQGMLGGMGGGAIDFLVQTHATAHRSELWIQYTVYLANGRDGSAVTVRLATTRDFSVSLGTAVHKQWQRIDALDNQGNSGQWWRVTERWKIDRATKPLFIRIKTNDKEPVGIFDSVDILTRPLVEDVKG